VNVKVIVVLLNNKAVRVFLHSPLKLHFGTHALKTVYQLCEISIVGLNCVFIINVTLLFFQLSLIKVF